MFTFVKKLFKNKNELILDNIEDQFRIVQNELGQYGLQRAIPLQDDDNRNLFYWTDVNVKWYGTDLETVKRDRLEIIDKLIYEKKLNTVTGVVSNVLS